MKAPFHNWLTITTLAFLLVGGSAVARSPGGAPIPAYTGTLQTIEEGLAADLVFLQGGLQRGFQNGMLLEVVQDGTPVAKLIVVGSQPTVSAALILNINPEAVIQPGDPVRVKTRKSPLFS